MFLNLVFVRAVSPGLGPSFDQLIYTSSSPPAWRTCAAAEWFFSRWDSALGWMSYSRRPNPVSFANLFRVIASGHPIKGSIPCPHRQRSSVHFVLFGKDFSCAQIKGENAELLLRKFSWAPYPYQLPSEGLQEYCATASVKRCQRCVIAI